MSQTDGFMSRYHKVLNSLNFMTIIMMSFNNKSKHTNFVPIYLSFQIIDVLDEIIERKGEPEITGVRDMLTDKNTLAAILIPCDILDPIIGFSDYLQGSVNFSRVFMKLKVNMIYHFFQNFCHTHKTHQFIK